MFVSSVEFDALWADGWFPRRGMFDVATVVGGLFAWKGVRDIGKGGFAPAGTVETVKQDVDWARREMRDLKEELTKES